MAWSLKDCRPCPVRHRLSWTSSFLVKCYILLHFLTLQPLFAKKLFRYSQPFYFTWMVVPLNRYVYITTARRTCKEYSHWLIIFNQPIKIFLANVEGRYRHSTVDVFIFKHGRKDLIFLDWKCRE